MVGGKFKLTGRWGEFGGFFAPLLNTAMKTMGLDDDLDSRFVLLLSVGLDCHSSVLVHFKTSVFVQSLAQDETRDAPRHTRCVRQLSCGYTDLYFRYEYNTWTTVRVYSAWCGAVTKISSSSLISNILRDPILRLFIVVRVIIVVTIATIAQWRAGVDRAPALMEATLEGDNLHPDTICMAPVRTM